MKPKKLFMILSLAIIITMGVSGCMGNQPGKTNENGGDTVDKMISYLNEKYEDEFSYSEPFGGGAGATSKQIYAKSQKFPNANVWVEYTNADGQESFADNYIYIKYESDVREILQNILTKTVKDRSVILSYGIGASGGSDVFTAKTSLKEFICSPQASIGFSAVISPGFLVNKESFENELLQNIKKEEILVASFGTIYFANTDAQFELPESLSIKELDDMTQFTFYMQSANSFIEAKWR